MNHPASTPRRLYVPHVDGTLTGSPLLVGGQLPVLTDQARAREFLTTYLETHPADVSAHPPAQPLAVCEVDATITAQGRLTFPVDRDQALTQPHRQVVAVGPLQRPHPRALAVAHTVAWSQANAALRDRRVTDLHNPPVEAEIVRARNAVQAAWRHGHDVAYVNSWHALAGAAQTMGHRPAAAGPSVRTPAPPPRLLAAAARFAGSDQIVEVVEQAWRSGLAHGGRRGTYRAAEAVTGGRPAALRSALTTVTAEWTNPHLAQLASELGGLGRTWQPHRSIVLSRLDTYLAGWRLADAAAARPTIPLTPRRPQTPPARRPPPPAAGTSPRRGPTR
jgi:hypothetical protein